MCCPSFETPTTALLNLELRIGIDSWFEKSDSPLHFARHTDWETFLFFCSKS